MYTPMIATNQINRSVPVAAMVITAQGIREAIWDWIARPKPIPLGRLALGLTAGALALPNLLTATAQAALTSEELQKAGIRQEGGEFRKDFSQSFPLAARGTFALDNINGRTEIRGWSSNVVAITAVIHGSTGECVNDARITVDADAEQARVHTDTPSAKTGSASAWAWFRGTRNESATIDYTVRVPEQVRLKDVSSVNGEIRIEGMAGDITASVVNGETEVKHAIGNLKLETVNGAIHAEMDALSRGQSVTLNAVNGEMTLSLPENADAAFAVSTVNGGISSEFPTLQPVKEFPVGNHLNGSLGQGAGQVKAGAVNGAIHFLKRPIRLGLASPSPAR